MSTDCRPTINRRRFAMAAAASLWSGRFVRAESFPSLEPGKAVSVPWESLKYPLIVRLPDDYAPGKAWPVIFHFHGSGGNPTIDIPLTYGAGKNFVLVGMEYVTRDMPAATADYLEQEWSSLQKIRTALAAVAKIDPKQTYVGGFSQGGWFASEFMEVYGRDLAGAYILGAGKRPRNKRQPKPFGAARPVFLGAGQLDINYPYALNGIRHFSGLGGKVTFEDFLGLAHHMPMGGGEALAPGFSQWLRVLAMRDTPAAVQSEALAWLREQMKLADAEAGPLRQWLRLSRAARLPFFTAATEPARKAFQERIDSLEKSAELKPEMTARTAYSQILEAELKAETMNGDLWTYMHDQARRYADLWQQLPDSYHGKRAAFELGRLEDYFSHTELWRFPNEEAKTKRLAEAAAHPLPVPPLEPLKKEFRDLWRTLAAPGTPARGG